MLEVEDTSPVTPDRAEATRTTRSTDLQEKVWEAVGVAEKVWEAVGVAEKVWEAVGVAEKVWEAVGVAEKVWEAVGAAAAILENMREKKHVCERRSVKWYRWTRPEFRCGETCGKRISAGPVEQYKDY